MFQIMSLYESSVFDKIKKNKMDKSAGTVRCPQDRQISQEPQSYP